MRDFVSKEDAEELTISKKTAMAMPELSWHTPATVYR